MFKAGGQKDIIPKSMLVARDKSSEASGRGITAGEMEAPSPQVAPKMPHHVTSTCYYEDARSCHQCISNCWSPSSIIIASAWVAICKP